jgi:hypothetical protein
MDWVWEWIHLPYHEWNYSEAMRLEYHFLLDAVLNYIIACNGKT